jgi:hypothetical protein
MLCFVYPSIASVIPLIIALFADFYLVLLFINYSKSSPDEVRCSHVSGLSIPENMPCTVKFLPDKIKIISSGANFTINKSKITDICQKSDVEIQKQYVSSVGGAVAGGVLLGPVGAIIGGRSKKKTSKTYVFYMVVTYRNEDDLSYVVFELPSAMTNASKLIKEFNKNNSTKKVSYEL